MAPAGLGAGRVAGRGCVRDKVWGAAHGLVAESRAWVGAGGRAGGCQHWVAYGAGGGSVGDDSPTPSHTWEGGRIAPSLTHTRVGGGIVLHMYPHTWYSLTHTHTGRVGTGWGVLQLAGRAVGRRVGRHNDRRV